MSIDPPAASSAELAAENERAALELKRLAKEVEKLTLEVAALQASTYWDRLIGRYLPLLTALVAVAGFWFGVIQYVNQQKASDLQRNEQQKASDRQRIEQQKISDQQRVEAEHLRADELKREAARPFWESQLRLYLRATEAAATVATSKKPEERARAEAEFWVLYWGPLAAVEDVGIERQSKAEIEEAMVQFGRYLQKHPQERDSDDLEQLSLQLAHAVRNAVGPAFDLEATPLAGLRTPSPK